MRILQVGLSHNPGGVESFVMNYYRELVKYDVQFDFICMYDTLAYEEEIKSLGGMVFYVSNVKKHPVRFRRELLKILKNTNYDVIHVNMLSAANIVPLIVGKKAQVSKVIAHSHNSSTPGILRNLLHCFNKPRILRYATDFFACSEVAGEWLFAKETMQSERFHVIHNALHVEKFFYQESIRQEIRKKLNVEDKFVIGHVGRFEEQKNHGFLVDIFYEIAKERKDAVLLLVGDGELKEQIAKWREKGQVGRPVRAMVVGVPNVGKSTFINKVARKKSAKASDRPGVTRGKQWVNVDQSLDLLDTPGILWPKFEDETTGMHLAFTGAVKDDIMDVETLACHLMTLLAQRYPDALMTGYKLKEIPTRETEENDVAYGYRLLENCALKRGMRISGGEFDTERMARVLLDEFRGGKLGRFTLEIPESK